MVSGIDLALVNTRYIGALSDLHLPPVDVVNEAFSMIAAAGPHTRVALTPTPAKRRWGYAPASVPPVQQVPDSVADNGIASVLTHIRRRSGARSPLQVFVSDRHLAVDTHHGLGDGRMFIDLASALLAVSSGGTSPWVNKRDSRFALPRALARTFTRDPSLLHRGWEALGALRSSRPLDSMAIPAQPWSPSYAVEVVFLSADVNSEVERWRKTNTSSCGSGALWLYLVRQAFHAVGVEMTERVQVAFDCRRYLGDGLSANGNFATGVEIPVPAGESVSGVGSRMRLVTSSALPLAMMAVASAHISVRGAPKATDPPTISRPGVPARMMYSDLGRITPLDGAPWRADGLQSFTGLLDPSGPDGITVLNASIGGQRSISISFHDNMFDRQVISKVARYIEDDPIRLLQG
jgi:hypothetical protein